MNEVVNIKVIEGIDVRGKHVLMQCLLLAIAILQVLRVDPSVLLLHMHQKALEKWLHALVRMYQQWFTITIMYKL